MRRIERKKGKNMTDELLVDLKKLYDEEFLKQYISGRQSISQLMELGALKDNDVAEEFIKNSNEVIALLETENKTFDTYNKIGILVNENFDVSNKIELKEELETKDAK